MNAKLIVFVALSVSVLGRTGFGPTDQEWGYVDVRPGAHLFWWLHKTTAAYVQNYTERPLIIWLQGGPGSSGTGMGNFYEIGPLDMNLNPRNNAWVNDFNILFVDNPVGCGFSYIDSDSDLVTSSKQQARDFLVFLQDFFKTLPEFQNVPLYIFGESYGGKYTVEIALLLSQAIKEQSLKANFKGIGLGDASISPSDEIEAYAPYLLSLGAIDEQGFDLIKNASKDAAEAINAKDWTEALYRTVLLETTTKNLTNCINWYNVLEKVPIQPAGQCKKDFYETDLKLEDIMNKNVKKALGLNVKWRSLADNVHEKLKMEMAMPVSEIVEQLLNTTDLKIAVYNGQLDLIISTEGTMKWIDKLKFESNWKDAPRQPLIANGIIEGYFKESGNLAFYSVNRAGHMVPTNNPDAMRVILERVTNDYSEK